MSFAVVMLWCLCVFVPSGAVVQPLPSSHLIFRAPSQAAGKCWMDALELAVRCSSILIRSMTSSSKSDNNSISSSTLAANKWNESDYEKHFKDQGEPLGLCERENVCVWMWVGVWVWVCKRMEKALFGNSHRSVYVLYLDFCISIQCVFSMHRIFSSRIY